MGVKLYPIQPRGNVMKKLICALMLVSVTACGGKKAQESCDEISEVASAKYSECGVEISKQELSQACCSGGDCDKTVKDDCEDCKKQIPETPCETLVYFGMPSACKGCVKPL
jgi:hypothetical protein